jgi:hypothetical protein
MPGFWGADSVSACNSAIDGTTLANYTINTFFAGTPHDEIVFWGRYFDLGTDEGATYSGDAEAEALNYAVTHYSNPSNGLSWILPIAAPYYGGGVGQNGTYGQGQYSGQYACGHIVSNLSSHLKMPGSNVLYVYVDLEDGTNQNFVEGWADGVDTYSYNGSLPFYPACYSAPTSDGPPATYYVNSYPVYFVAWSTEPEPLCSGCSSPGPSWAPDAVGSFSTYIWQYAENGGNACGQCRSGFPVDLDQTNPSIEGAYGYGVCDNMLYIPA